MDWVTNGMELHRKALKSVLATIVFMLGLDELKQNAEARAAYAGAADALTDNASAPDPEPPFTMLRYQHRGFCNLMRAAEAAARRLVVVAARGLPLPKLSTYRPRPAPAPGSPNGNTGPVTGPNQLPPRPARQVLLPLADPLNRGIFAKPRRRYVPNHAAPRILSFDMPYQPRPPPPAPDDDVDASRLALRAEALRSALDDLPAQAKRLMRWKARNLAAKQRNDMAMAEERKTGIPAKLRISRLSPLKGGRPYGWRSPRPTRYNPNRPPPWVRTQAHRAIWARHHPAGIARDPFRAVMADLQEILKETNSLAWQMRFLDTS